MVTRGIDVSSYQGIVDWRTMRRKHSLGWAAVKATEGDGYVNPTFATNWSRLADAGIVRVAYHYARPGGSASSQAGRFLDVVRPAPGDVLCLDLEAGDGQSSEHINAWARQFGQALRRAAPSAALWLYVGAGWAANGTGRGLADTYDYWWMPRYAWVPGTQHTWTSWTSVTRPPVPAGLTLGWSAPHVWQFTDNLATGQGGMDASVSAAPIAALARPRAAPVPQPVVVPPIVIPAPPAPQEQDMALIVSPQNRVYWLAGSTPIYLNREGLKAFLDAGHKMARVTPEFMAQLEQAKTAPPAAVSEAALTAALSSALASTHIAFSKGV
jgi:hypothetical protein